MYNEYRDPIFGLITQRLHTAPNGLPSYSGLYACLDAYTDGTIPGDVLPPPELVGVTIPLLLAQFVTVNVANVSNIL